MSKNLKLKGAIVASGLTYDELALKVGCTTPTIQRAVNDGNVGLMTAKHIAIELDLTLNDLFGDYINKKGGE